VAIARSDDIGVEAWVRRSCRDQGIQVHVTDASVIRQVASILGCATALTVIGEGRRRRLRNRDSLADRAAAHRKAQEREGAADDPRSPEKQV